MILVILCFLALIYGFYQLIRNNAVFKIRIKWIDEDDSRHDNYTYNEMFAINKHTWYGLKYPKESQYK